MNKKQTVKKGKIKSKVTRKTTSKARSKNKPKEVSIFTILFVLAFIAIIVGIYFGIRHLVITLKYKQYTDKMVEYGYNELYDNKKATATDTLTKGELIKVVFGTIKNETDITKLYYGANKNFKDMDNWYAYYEYLGMDNISKSKLNEKATNIEAVLLITDCMGAFLSEDVQQVKLEIKQSKLDEYSIEEQEKIAKAVTLELIPNQTSAISNNEIIKGELNKMLITMVEKYATIYFGSITVNENGMLEKTDVNLVTDRKDKPENYKEYPYIIDTIDKEVYEYDYQIMTQLTFRNPKESYEIMGYLYGQTNDLIERYFDKILNVDYTTITTENFLSSITHDVTYLLDEQDVKPYVDYVKANKIKLEGSATPLLPIMYNNGEQYVVRTKITFKVLNSDTEYNLLFGDENSKVKYNSKEITMYVDVPMGMTINSNSLRIYVTNLAKHISNNNSLVKVEE